MSNEIQQRPKTVAGICDSPTVQKRLQEVLGKKASQFVSSLISVTNNNKLLSKADPNTVVASAMVAATLDLPINQSLGFAYIVPYKGQAQFQLGYKGLIQLAMRSGQFKTLNDVVVPHGALKHYDPVTGEVEIDWDAGDESKPADGYLVYMALVNGFSKKVFWSREKVEKHASRFSQAYSKGYESPWKSDFDAMALKTVIKFVLGKYAPLSVDMQKGIEADQGIVDMDGNVTGYPDNEPEKEDPFRTAKQADKVEDDELEPESAEEPAAKEPEAKAEESTPTTTSHPDGDPDELAELMMDSGLSDAATRKAGIALGILPKDFKASVMEAETSQVGGLIDRFDEIRKMGVK